MANRKHQNLEIERQLKHRKYVFRAITLAITAVLLVAAIIGIWTVQDRRWIMRYDNGRVATGDFRILFEHNWEGNPAAREAALTSLQSIVVLRDRAAAHNVDFTPEERAHADAIAASIRQMYTTHDNVDLIRFINNQRLGELFLTTPLVERLIDIYEPYYTIDEEEFAAQLETYLEANLINHQDFQVLFVTRETEEEAYEALEMLETMSFEELVRAGTDWDWVDPDEEIEPFALTDIETGGILAQLEQMMMTPEDREQLLALQEGETSTPIMVWDFEVTGAPLYVIVHMVYVGEAPDVADVEASYRERLIEEGRNDAFFDRVMSWVDEANFVINQRGYNTV